MRKNTIIVLVSLLVIVSIGGFFYVQSSNRKSESEVTDNQNATGPDSNIPETEELAVDYQLSDNRHILKIKQSDSIYVKNTTFSTPDNVNVAFSYSDFDMANLPVGNMMVIPIDYVKGKTKKLKLNAKYEDDLQKFMAFNSSTQCSILQPEDFEKKNIAGYSVWVAKRTDNCTFGLDKPAKQIINMYGFETNGYTVVLSVNGTIEDIPENSDKLMETVISLTTVE